MKKQWNPVTSVGEWPQTVYSGMLPKEREPVVCWLTFSDQSKPDWPWMGYLRLHSGGPFFVCHGVQDPFVVTYFKRVGRP